MMPATISPITCGWRIRANNSPIARLSATISATWSRRRKMRLCPAILRQHRTRVARQSNRVGAVKRVLTGPAHIIRTGAPMAHTVVDRQIVYNGKKVRLELHHLEDPDTGRRHKREVCVRPGAVVVLPILPDGRVVLIKNYRYAV